MEITTLNLVLAKNVLQVHGTSSRGRSSFDSLDVRR